ncbi:MAG TPA: hypothetical protein VNC50_11690, partial [Planctomycetia bacterium]|nr:hypothetical protein [Planctomycetia bacterium]
DSEGPFRTGDAPSGGTAGGGMNAGAGGNTSRAAKFAEALDERRRQQAGAMAAGPAPFDAPEFLPQGESNSNQEDDGPPLSPSGGLMLQRIANSDQPETGGERRRLSAYDPLRMETGGGVERIVPVLVKAGSAKVAGEAIALDGDDENAEARRVLTAVAREVGGWSREPTGRRWKPVVLLKTTPGGSAAAWRLRLAMELAGVPTRSAWCSESGATTLDWGGEAGR